uniref:Transposase n=1 Tax=Ascaris lumbricoides TaxID=6252 RepID=A0A0M3HY12_ASCLU
MVRDQRVVEWTKLRFMDAKIDDPAPATTRFDAMTVWSKSVNGLKEKQIDKTRPMGRREQQKGHENRDQSTHVERHLKLRLQLRANSEISQFAQCQTTITIT